MATAAAYEPMTVGDTQASGSSASSHDSSTSARLTPDETGSPEDDLDASVDGYELKSLRSNASTAARGPAEDDLGGDDSGHDDDLHPASRTRHRAASVQSFELYTPDEERLVRRKLDTHLVLFVALLYMLSFLDRSNIGNARVAGLARDLKLSDNQYEWLLTIFYINYILFEWMTLCYKIFPPHIYISCCVLAWGILASLQSVVTSYAFMLVLRALLGIGEAAFVGIPFYLSFFFRKEELAFRIGLFISAAPLATSFASSLAWLIVKFGDHSGIASWRLLFLVEGFPACLVAVWAWQWLPDSPSTARWLNSRERKIATLRMRKEIMVSTNPSEEKPSTTASTIPRHKRKLQWSLIFDTLKDPKSYLTAGMFFACNVAFSSMPVFLPTILSHMGFSRLAAQGLAAPPFLFSFVVVLVTAVLSDRLQSRSMPMLFHASLACTGYIFLALAGALNWEGPLAHILRYAAIFPICAGFFSAVTIVITWTVNNQHSDEGKGTGMAILNVIGQLGPLVGTRLYPDAEGPFYVKGMSVCAAAMAIVGILALTLRVVLKRENAKQLKQEALGVAEGEGLIQRRDGVRLGAVYML